MHLVIIKWLINRIKYDVSNQYIDLYVFCLLWVLLYLCVPKKQGEKKSTEEVFDAFFNSIFPM